MARHGRPSELPGDGSGYQRVVSDGNDTWDQGTEVEKEHNPNDLIVVPANESSKSKTDNDSGGDLFPNDEVTEDTDSQ